MGNSLPPQRVKVAGTLFLIAAWFGLLTGLLEGGAFMFFQKFYWLNRHLVLMDVSIEILWIAPIFNFLLFGVVGLALIPLSRFIGQRRVIVVSVFVFAFLGFLDLLAMMFSKHLYAYAILFLAVGLALALTRWFRKRELTVLSFWRRSVTWVGSVVVLTLVCIEGGLWLKERRAISNLPQTPRNSQNVLVIVVDALRADHLSSYGYARPTSPNLDKLAGQGVLFENAFSTSSWTLPSHASMLTGRYPSEIGVEWDNPRAMLDSRYPTLAEELLQRGYRTSAFSANQFWFTRSMGFGRGFIRFEDYFHSVGDMTIRTMYGRAFESIVLRRLGFEDIPTRKYARDINNSVLRWIDRDLEKPFFAFLNYMDAHDPYLPPQPYRRKFSQIDKPGGILNWRVGRNHLKMSTDQVQSEMDAYDGAISYVDEQIGQLLGELKNRGLLDNTVIVITSDHGEGFGEHDLFLHANSLYREMIHVPLIIWKPGQVPADVRIAQSVTNAALPATLMDLLGAENQSPFPGQSLAQLWKDPKPHPNWPYPLTEIARQPWALPEFPVYSGSMKSLVSEQWHYIEHEKDGAKLYDLKNDFLETRDLAKMPEMQDVIARLRSQLLLRQK